MRKAKGTQRGAFEGVGDGAQTFSQRRSAGDDVVVAGKDARVVNGADGETIEEAAQASGGIGPDVGGQIIAQRRGQPIDQRRVAEMVSPAPKDAVCLERVEPVGDKDDDAPASPPFTSTKLSTSGRLRTARHAHHLGHAGPVIGHVLQYLVGKDHVKGSVGEGEALARGLNHASGPLPRL